MINSDSELETNLDEIATQICQQPPRPPGSIRLIMEHDLDPNLEFDVIHDFTMACLKTLWGPLTTPSDLDQTRLELLQQYVRSVGYQLKVRVTDDLDHMDLHISFEHYRSAKENPYNHLRKYM